MDTFDDKYKKEFINYKSKLYNNCYTKNMKYKKKCFCCEKVKSIFILTDLDFPDGGHFKLCIPCRFKLTFLE